MIFTCISDSVCRPKGKKKGSESRVHNVCPTQVNVFGNIVTSHWIPFIEQKNYSDIFNPIPFISHFVKYRWPPGIHGEFDRFYVIPTKLSEMRFEEELIYGIRPSNYCRVLVMKQTVSLLFVHYIQCFPNANHVLFHCVTNSSTNSFCALRNANEIKLQS